MPFLDITSAQPSLQIRLGSSRDGSLVGGRALSSLFISRNGTRSVSSWKSLTLPMTLHSNAGPFEIQRGRVVIKAVATFETKNLVLGHDEQKGKKNSDKEVESASEDSTEVDEKERLRRKRISQANKGKTPWNMGRKHSPETRRLIRERTRIAMQDPKIKMKLVKYGHAQSDETKEKIGASVRRTFLKRREKRVIQEICHYEWQNLIAEASRTGSKGEEELQWDSFEILDEQLQKEWLESLEQKKIVKAKRCQRAPKSPEQKRKIAEAIAAKWADPAYRERVLTGLHKYHGASERKPRRKPSSNTTSQSPRPSRPKKKAFETQISFVREAKPPPEKPKRRGPQYKDPLVRAKLEMIKNIRAQRATLESRQAEAITQARLSIAEAQKASKALELSAETSPIAREALLETRKLIAKAIQLVEAMETGQTNETNSEEPPDALASKFEEIKDELVNHEEQRNINGVPSHGENHGYGKVSVQDIILNDEEEFVSSVISRKSTNLPQLNVEDLVKQLGTNAPIKQSGELESDWNVAFEKGSSLNGAFDRAIEEEKSLPPRSVGKTKKWVRGRLVEVSGEEEEVEKGNQEMSDYEEEDWSLSEEDQSHDEELEDWSQSEEGLSEELEDWSESEEEDDEKKGLSEEDWSHDGDDVKNGN